MNTITIKTDGKKVDVNCTQTFASAEGEVKNRYRCGQTKFTAADAWKIFGKKVQTIVK